MVLAVLVSFASFSCGTQQTQEQDGSKGQSATATREDAQDTTMIFGDAVLVNYGYLIKNENYRDDPADKSMFEVMVRDIQSKVAKTVYVGMTNASFLSSVDSIGNRISSVSLIETPYKCVVIRSNGQLIPIRNIDDISEIQSALNQPLTNQYDAEEEQEKLKQLLEEEKKKAAEPEVKKSGNN